MGTLTHKKPCIWEKNPQLSKSCRYKKKNGRTVGVRPLSKNGRPKKKKPVGAPTIFWIKKNPPFFAISLPYIILCKNTGFCIYVPPSKIAAIAEGQHKYPFKILKQHF